MDTVQLIPLLQYLSIPFVAAFIGWFTNRVAIKMTFYPLEFVGIKPWLGWQGIIPSKSIKMARKAVDILTNRLIKIEDEFAKIDAGRVAAEMKPNLEFLCENTINEVMKTEAPNAWRAVPDAAKQIIYARASADFPASIKAMMEEIKTQSTSLINFEQLVVEELTRDKTMLNKLFMECGHKEFKFIERSGLYFGFLFGLVQMVLWYFFPWWWILPVFGLINGYLTNWLALKLIFHPEEPVYFGKWYVQGLFIKRQKEVSQAYARVIATDILTSEKIFEKMMRSAASNSLNQIIFTYIEKAVDMAAGNSKHLIHLLKGKSKYKEIKALARKRFMKMLPVSLVTVLRYTDKAIDIENTLSTKLCALPPKEFVGVLHPVFEEDEWILIAVGAALGVVAGFVQLLIV